MKRLFKFLIMPFRIIFVKLFSILKSFHNYVHIVLFSNRKSIIATLLLFIVLSALNFSITTISSFLPNNRINSINLIADEYISTSNEAPYGVVFPYKNVPSVYDYNVYSDQEKLKEIRNVYPELTIFSLYKANWRSGFAPAVVDYISQSNNPISIMLMPKNIEGGDNGFLYEMPLLSGNMQLYSGSNDIYINIEYANWLLVELGYSAYDELINLVIDIESKHFSTIVKDGCVIKGVIDSESEEYQKYQNIFGDFFIAPEYYTVNMTAITFFELSTNSISNYKYLSIMDRLFKYSTKMLAYTNNNKVYIYEYRISLLSDSQNGSDNILNLGKSTDDMDKKCMAIYDFYYSLSYILNILIFGALVLILIFFEWTIIANIRTMASQNKTIQKIKLSQTNLVIFIAFLNILSISIGYILTRVLNIALNYSFLSINNPTAFILILVFFVMTILLFAIPKRKKNEQGLALKSR